MTNPIRLAALAAVAIEGVAPDSKAWYEEMSRIITRAQMAAWMAGMAEKLGVKLDSPLLSQRRLSRAERAEIKALVEAQLKYLRAFDKERASLSPAQIAARMQLYAGATKQAYLVIRWGDWDVPPSLMPGNQTCLTQCLCRAHVKDNGDGTGLWVREMGGTERHCTQCPALVGEHPIQRKGYSATKHLPGQHDQRSHGHSGGGHGGGSSDVQRQLRNIEEELSGRYVSVARREALEERRRELLGTSDQPVGDKPISQPSDRERRLRSIDEELASRYISQGRREVLEEQRLELTGGKKTPRDLAKELDAAEKEIRPLTYEQAIYFSPDGRRLVQVKGDEKSFTVPEKEFNSLRGVNATMTHNHPSGHKYSPSDPRHRGDSFSLSDVRQAAYLGLAEARAVTPTRRFWMKPPKGGWQEHHWRKAIPDSYKKHYDTVLPDLVRQVRAGRITQAEANARLYHEVWSRVSKELGISYGYEDR